MKLAVVACLHGNAMGLEAVLADAKARQATQVVAVGDLLGGHPDHAEVIRILRDANLATVTGVLDEAALGDLADAKAMGDNPFSRAFLWAAEHLSEEDRRWIHALPKTHGIEGGGSPHLVVCHNSPRKLDEKMDWTTTFTDRAYGEIFEQTGAGVIARANLHGQFSVARGGRMVVNVGTGGVPVDGDARAGYALFEAVPGGWRVDLLRIPYDTERAAQRILDSGMPDGEARARLTRTGIRTW